MAFEQKSTKDMAGIEQDMLDRARIERSASPGTLVRHAISQGALREDAERALRRLIESGRLAADKYAMLVVGEAAHG